MRKILIIGSASFIDFYLSKTLLEQDAVIVGLDYLSDYYYYAS